MSQLPYRQVADGISTAGGLSPEPGGGGGTPAHARKVRASTARHKAFTTRPMSTSATGERGNAAACGERLLHVHISRQRILTGLIDVAVEIIDPSFHRRYQNLGAFDDPRFCETVFDALAEFVLAEAGRGDPAEIGKIDGPVISDPDLRVEFGLTDNLDLQHVGGDQAAACCVRRSESGEP